MPFALPPFLVPRGRDLVEILLVAWLLYRGLRLLVGTRALQILLGLLFLLAVYVSAFLLKFTMITYVLGVVFTYGVFALLVVFQPEVRNALARLGRARVFRAFTAGHTTEVAGEIAEGAERLSRAGSGAIIAVERENTLEEYLESGTALTATVSADLLAAIFTRYSPLHDGAVLIRGDQIIGAACILPLTQQPVTDRTLGTRHRAALGLSEETDALVVVVSEETTTISLAAGGRMYRGLTVDRLEQVLAGRETPEALATPAAAG